MGAAQAGRLAVSRPEVSGRLFCLEQPGQKAITWEIRAGQANALIQGLRKYVRRGKDRLRRVFVSYTVADSQHYDDVQNAHRDVDGVIRVAVITPDFATLKQADFDMGKLPDIRELRFMDEKG